MDSYLADDGGPEVVAVEAADGTPQSLWVRVGPVYYDGNGRDDPGVWICYQENHMTGPLAGPVLLTPAVWRSLIAAIEKRLHKHGAGHAYLSTSCLHDEHGYCQSPEGTAAGGETWQKTPAACKFCDAPCTCRCHCPFCHGEGDCAECDPETVWK